MTKTVALFFAAALCICLSGCDRNCDECEDAQAQHSDHASVSQCNACGPAPAPLAQTAACDCGQSGKPVTSSSTENSAAPAQPDRKYQIVEARKEKPVRVHHIISGEIEIDDL